MATRLNRMHVSRLNGIHCQRMEKSLLVMFFNNLNYILLLFFNRIYFLALYL